MERVDNNKNVTATHGDVEAANWRKKLAEERAERDAANRQAFGDFSEVIPYLNETVGFDLTAIGVTDTKVIQASEAFIGEMFTRYVCEIQETDAAYFRWVSAEEFMFWTGTGWKSGDAETMRSIIRRVLLDAGAGRVYSFYSPRRVAKEVLAELCQHPDKQYAPTTDMITFCNGILNLNTMELQSFSKDLQPKWAIAFDFDPTASCPLFEKTVSDVLDTDTGLLFQEICGNMFLDFRHEVIALLTGGGGNGKSTLLEAVVEALGKENVSSYNITQLSQADGTHVSGFVGKIANINFDSSKDIKVGSEATLKSLASGEPTLSRTLYRQPQLTRDYGKIILAMNNLPQTSDFSDGFFRRLVFVPFDRKVPADKIDLELKSKLKKERQGILNWILQGTQRLRANGKFTRSLASEKAANSYRIDADAVASFLEAKDYQPSDTPTMTLAKLFEIFDEWRRASGYNQMTVKKFSARLRVLNIRTDKVGGVIKVWVDNAADKDMPF